MGRTFEIEPPHDACDVRVYARLPLKGSVDFSRILQPIGRELAPRVEATLAKAAIKFEDACLAFDVTKIEASLSCPGASSQVETRDAAILQPCHWGHVACILEKTFLSATTKSLTSREACGIERGH